MRESTFDRVVALSKEREVGGCGGIRAVGGELRQPEQVEVRFVADGNVAHLR
jgi:hypothetical protein